MSDNILYPVRYQDSLDLAGQDDSLVRLTSGQARLLQSILNNVESNPDIFIADYATQDTDEVDEFLSATMLALMSVPVVHEWRYQPIRLHVNGWTSVNGALTWSPDTQQDGGGTWILANTIGSFIDYYKVPLRASRYQLYCNCVMNNSSCIISVKLDGTIVTTFDLYRATQLKNARIQANTFDISTDTTPTSLKFEITGKNASSSNYNCQISSFDIHAYP